MPHQHGDLNLDPQDLHKCWEGRVVTLGEPHAEEAETEICRASWLDSSPERQRVLDLSKDSASI